MTTKELATMLNTELTEREANAVRAVYDALPPETARRDTRRLWRLGGVMVFEATAYVSGKGSINHGQAVEEINKILVGIAKVRAK